MTGPIPTELGNLVHLTVLSISFNRLSGAIPAQLGELAMLEVLYLSNNRLSGAMPAELGALSVLRKLEIHNNPLLTGCVPAALEDSLDSYEFGELEFCGT